MARRYKFAPPKGTKPPQVTKQKPRINKTMVAIFVFLISAGLLGSTIIWSLPNGISGSPGGASAPTANQIKSLLAAVYADPENANAKVSLANAYFDNKQYPEAIVQYENAVAKGIKNENVYGDLAITYFYTNQVDKAIETAKKSLEIKPDFANMNLNLAIFLAEGKGNYNAAVAQLEDYLKKDKNNQQAQDLLKQYKAQAQSPVK